MIFAPVPPAKNTPQELLLKSYAKLNLYLEVLKKRPDNYHNLVTIFERIDIFDAIKINLRRDRKIRVITDSPSVSQGNSNLAYQSAKLMQDKFGIGQGVDISINKNIPVAAGLGGGSSNAASVLLGLNKLWKLHLCRRQLCGLAGRIGSDVPFFIYDTPFARAELRGEKITPLGALKKLKLWHILAVPRIKVSTPLIYQAWDKLNQSRRLTSPRYDVKIITSALRKKDLALLGDALFNGLEVATAGLYPQIKQARDKFRYLGLKAILMSGSGPAVFAIVSSRKEALSLGRQLKQEGGSEVFVTRTV